VNGIIKIGVIVDDEAKLSSFLKDFAQLRGTVHGGGKLATQMAAQLNIPQQMIDAGESQMRLRYAW
jgi:acetylglutamate kinase